MAAKAAAARNGAGRPRFLCFPSRWPAQTVESGEILEPGKVAHSFLLERSRRCLLSPHAAAYLRPCRLTEDLPATPKPTNPRPAGGTGGAREYSAGADIRAPPPTNPRSRQAKALPLSPSCQFGGRRFKFYWVLTPQSLVTRPLLSLLSGLRVPHS